MAKPNLDKLNRDYDLLLLRQREELAQWRLLLKPEVHSALVDWCEMVNGPAEPWDPNYRGPYKAGGLHSVPIGCELHHFLMRYKRRAEYARFTLPGSIPSYGISKGGTSDHELL